MSAVENYQGGGGRLLCSLLEIEKSDPVCWGKCPDYGDLWVNFSLQMQFQKYLGENKNPNFSPWGLSRLFVVAKMFLEVAFFLETSVLKNSLLHAWSITIAGWKKKLLGFEPAKISLFQWFDTLKSPYLKVYFSFTWHLESPYIDLLQFKHKCSYLLLTNLKKTIYHSGAVIEKHGY